MKNIKTRYVLIGLALLIAGGFAWSMYLQSNGPTVISRNGIHWHPHIEIFVNGEKLDIPANIGVGPQYAGLPTFDAGMRMTAMHTHEDVPIIHLEFPGVVRKNDIMLGNFFRIWGRDMSSFGENMRMTVNGVANTEFDRYIMRDKDIIELHYD